MEKAGITSTISIVGPKAALNPANPQVIDVPTSFRVLEHEPVSTFPFSDPDVRVVSVAEYKEAALCLAEAFAEDDVARYFIDVPDREHWSEEAKWQLHLEILEYVTYAHCLKGLVTTVGDNYDAVALW
jgi:hypothetical protein